MSVYPRYGRRKSVASALAPGSRAQRRAARAGLAAGRILIRGLVGGAVVHGVEVPEVQQVPRFRADIREVQHEIGGQLHLEPEVPLVDNGRLPGVLVGVQPDRRVERRRRGEARHEPPLQVRRLGGRRVGDQVEHLVALRPVVEHPEGATGDVLPFSGDVVRRTDARRHPELVAVGQRVGDPLSGLVGPLEPVTRVGHDAADERRGHR